MTARGRGTPGCGSCLCEPVGVAWAWRLQEKRRGRPGLSGQAWCYVVGLVFPHVAFPAQRNEWLPTGLWPWPRLKEYTYQGPEYTPQPASQPASLCPGLWTLPTTSPPATDGLSHTLSHQLQWKEWNIIILSENWFSFYHSWTWRYCKCLFPYLSSQDTHSHHRGQKSNDRNDGSLELVACLKGGKDLLLRANLDVLPNSWWRYCVVLTDSSLWQFDSIFWFHTFCCVQCWKVHLDFAVKSHSYLDLLLKLPMRVKHKAVGNKMWPEDSHTKFLWVIFEIV